MNTIKIFRSSICVSLAVMAMAIMGTSCRKTSTYADYVIDEEKAIEAFLKAKNIDVVSDMPEESDGEWKSNGKETYYLYDYGKSDGLYYHQVEKGDGESPKDGWKAYVRYIGTSMSGEVLYNTTAAYSPDPMSFVVLSNAKNNRDATFGQGFQQAVKNLRVGGHCKVIIPFELGNSSLVTVDGKSRNDRSDYRPMFFEIWLVAIE